MNDATFYRRLQLSGILIAAGIVVQLTTLYWSHPMAFVIFILMGGSLVGMGIVVYLYSLVSR